MFAQHLFYKYYYYILGNKWNLGLLLFQGSNQWHTGLNTKRVSQEFLGNIIEHTQDPTVTAEIWNSYKRSCTVSYCESNAACLAAATDTVCGSFQLLRPILFSKVVTTWKVFDASASLGCIGVPSILRIFARSVRGSLTLFIPWMM